MYYLGYRLIIKNNSNLEKNSRLNQYFIKSNLHRLRKKKFRFKKYVNKKSNIRSYLKRVWKMHQKKALRKIRKPPLKKNLLFQLIKKRIKYKNLKKNRNLRQKNQKKKNKKNIRKFKVNLKKKKLKSLKKLTFFYKKLRAIKKLRKRKSLPFAQRFFFVKRKLRIKRRRPTKKKLSIIKLYIKPQFLKVSYSVFSKKKRIEKNIRQRRIFFFRKKKKMIKRIPPKRRILKKLLERSKMKAKIRLRYYKLKRNIYIKRKKRFKNYVKKTRTFFKSYLRSRKLKFFLFFLTRNHFNSKKFGLKFKRFIQKL